ncbi:MAG TPA: histidine phosphatase family protein [Bryobacteraceae bacterium]|nr:histidine phosphatase family protein [Bryobacteraceae bacterium]
MNLYVARHSRPVNGHPLDATRSLMADGKKEAAAVAGWLTKLIGRVDIVIASPFTRTQEQAEIMAESLGAHVAGTVMLQPDKDPVEAWKEIERLAQQSKDVLVVGHDPNLNKLILWLMGLTGGPDELRMDWGAVAYLKVKTGDGDPEGVLQWLVTPALVQRDPSEDELLEAARGLTDVI